MFAPRFAVPLPPREDPSFPDGRFDDLAIGFEGLRIREVGVVGPTLAAKDSLEDFEVRLLERGIVFRVEDPRHTPVPQDSNHLGLQHADL